VSSLPCPNCGSELAFLAQYQRYYCYPCGQYAPDGFGDRGAKRCPTCTGILSWIAQYERHYCHRCNAYPPEGIFIEKPVEAPPQTTLEPVAANQTTVVVLESPKVEEPTPAPVEVPAESASRAEPPATEEIVSEETVETAAKPALVRDEIVVAKKPLLMDLCKAYNLDPTGTKEELRERLLSYLDGLESEARAREVQEASPMVQEGIRGEIPTVEQEQIPPKQVLREQPDSSVESIVLAPKPEISRPLVELKEFSVLEKPAEEVVPSMSSASMTASGADARPTQTVLEPFATPVRIETPTREVTISEPVPIVRVEHPCPTCGRALTSIPQYDRWYCYSCRAYAPRATAKFACPNCGASLRWITQYERWWCEACRRYAPADLPKPDLAAARTRPIAPTLAQNAASMASPGVHRHRSPGSGIGLVGFGMVLFVVYEILVDLPIVLTVNTGVSIAPDVAFGLRFFAFLFVAVGAILGLYAVRDHR